MWDGPVIFFWPMIYRNYITKEFLLNNDNQSKRKQNEW